MSESEQSTPVDVDTSEQKEYVDERKLKKKQQLKEARENKKMIAKQREEENLRVRAELLSTKAEIERLKSDKKRIRTDDNNNVVDEDDDDNDDERPKKRRVRVTREPSADDDHPQTNSDKRGLVNEAAKIGIVSVLGLASWYVQNRLFREQKKQSPPPTRTTTTTSQVQKFVPSQHKFVPATSLFNKTNVDSKSNTIGKSGFSM